MTNNRSVIDIWSMQPQPHLQPRAALPRSSSSGSQRDIASSKNEPPVTVSAVSAASSHTASNNSTGTVPRHWGEVVINPRREKGRKSGNADAKERRDVFGVLEVSWGLFSFDLLIMLAARMIYCLPFPRLFCVFFCLLGWAGFCQVAGRRVFLYSLFLYSCCWLQSYHNTPFSCVIFFFFFAYPNACFFHHASPKH